MLMIRDGDKIRGIGRDSLPAGDVPEDGRLLTNAQVNDALHLARHAMSRRPGIGRDEYELGRVAVHHLLGHIVAVENALREARAEIDNNRGEGRPPSEGWVWTDPYREHCRPRWVKGDYSIEPMMDVDDLHTWTLWENGTGHGYPTARAAMRAADEKAAAAALEETPR